MSRRILFIRSVPFLPVTGSDISMFERLEMLERDHGWQVAAVSVSGMNEEQFLQGLAKTVGLTFQSDGEHLLYTFRRVPCIMRADPALDGLKSACVPAVITRLRQAILGVEPDLIIANFRDVPAVITLAQQAGIPAVTFLTENEYNRPEQLRSGTIAIEYARAVRSLQHVAVAGEFIRNSLRQSWQIEARMFVNSINVERYRLVKDNPGEFIGMFQPYKHKGLELFLRLAAAMPERQFLCTTGLTTNFRENYPRLRATPNIQIEEFTTEAAAIYRKCRLVLVPSFWEDVFPRVVVEALASGTPVIASTTGGIRQAGGDAAIYLDVERIKQGAPIEERDLQPWIDAIRTLDDPEVYSRRVELARQHTNQYAAALTESMAAMSAWFSALCAK